jgi:hypothetical protein
MSETVRHFENIIPKEGGKEIEHPIALRPSILPSTSSLLQLSSLICHCESGIKSSDDHHDTIASSHRRVGQYTIIPSSALSSLTFQVATQTIEEQAWALKNRLLGGSFLKK